MKTFKHNFTEPKNLSEAQQIMGYINCLRSLYKKLEEMTEFKPEKRFIDAVDLLDMITATTDELMLLFDAFRKKLEEKDVTAEVIT